MLETQVSNCVAEAQINGVPICRVGADGATLDSRPVNHFILPGSNVFTLVAQPGATPRTALTPNAIDSKAKENMSASLRLLSVPPGAFHDDPAAREMLSVNWKPKPAQPYRAPVLLSGQLEFPANLPAWSWTKGASLRSDAALESVGTMLADLLESFSRGDPEMFIARSNIRFTEVSTAFDTSIDDDVRRFREQFQRISTEPGFEMHALDPETMDLRICADGKLVECLDRAWEPLLRSMRSPNGITRLRYPMKVADIGGRLEIVR